MKSMVFKKNGEEISMGPSKKKKKKKEIQMGNKYMKRCSKKCK